MITMKFLNTDVDNLTFEEALQRIEELVDSKAGGYVVTPNVDHIICLEKNEDFRKSYEGASLVLTDGQPLIWISKLLKCPIKEKISGSDLLPAICAMAAKKKYRVYFLGAAQGIAAKAAKNLKKRNPGLKIVGTYSPAYGFEKDKNQVKKIWEMIHKADPDILIVGLGTPKQELFLWKNREELQGILAFGFGAGFDFESGRIKRAPRWMQRCGLEWLYRLSREPKRLFRRYLIEDMKIFRLIWKYRNRKESNKNEYCN